MAIITEAGAGQWYMDATGAVNAPLQPAFLCQPASVQSNFAENADVTVVFGTERFDQGSDFASNVFTAPVTGKYMLNTNIYFVGPQEAYNYLEVTIITSNRGYYNIVDSGTWDQDQAYMSMQVTVCAEMEASDTAYVSIKQDGTAGDASADIGTASYFSGFLAC